MANNLSSSVSSAFNKLCTDRIMSSNTGTSGSRTASQYHYELSSCRRFINTYDNPRDRNLLSTSETCRREDGSYREPTLRYTEEGERFHFRDGSSVLTAGENSPYGLAHSTPLSYAPLLLHKQPPEIADLFKTHRADSSSLVPASASEQQRMYNAKVLGKPSDERC